MGKKRRVFSSKFKSKVALEAIKSHETLNELSVKHSLHGNQISSWKRHLELKASELFDNQRGKKKQEEEELIDKLYREIGRLQVENAWLKKNLNP